MKRHQWIFVLIFAGVIGLLPASQVLAFDTMELEGDSQLTVYGWVRNNLGVFTDDIDYADDGNDPATCRTWLRTYLDYKISDSLTAWAAIQFVHEPSYQVERHSTSSNGTSAPLGDPILKDGKEYSEYYRVSDVLRECYIDWKATDNHNFRVGRQIVIWGESLTTRVADVIHPDDIRFTFAFANLEDTRIPLWMLRGNHQFPEISCGLEWLISPNITDEQYRVSRTANFATPDSLGVIQPGQRFGLHPEDRGAGGPPVSRFFTGVAPGVWIPTLGAPRVSKVYPENSIEDLRFGFRTSTFMEGYEFGVLYFHNQSYDPITRIAGRFTPGGFFGFQDVELIYPNQDIFGAYFNKDATVGVVRMETVYIPNKSFNTFDPAEHDAVVRSDYVKYMVSWDLGGTFMFDWHKDAPIDFSIDHVGEWLPSNSDHELQYVVYNTAWRRWTPNISTRLATTWIYGKIGTDIIASYNPLDTSGLFMPIVKYMPAIWNKALSFEVRYIRIFGESNYSGLGMLQQKDMVVLTTQLNF